MEHGAHDSQVAHYNDKIFFCVLIVGYFQKKANKKTVHEDKNSFLLYSYNIMFTQNVLNESHLFHFCQFCVKEDLWMIKCSLLCLFPDVFAFFIIANCDQHWNSTLVAATRPKYSCLFILYFFTVEPIICLTAVKTSWCSSWIEGNL